MDAQHRRASRQFPIRSGPCRLAIATLLLFTPLLVSSASAKEPFKVEWAEERLSVIAERIPLSQILREVASQTGMEVRGFEGLEEKVSVRFSDLSLREGLQKLLAHVNYFLVEKKSPQGGTRPALALVFGRRAAPLAEVIPSEEGTKLRGEPGAKVVILGEEKTEPEGEPGAEVVILGEEETQPEGEPAAEVVIPSE